MKNAHLFINYMLRADVAAKNSNFISFANSNAASWPLVSAEVKNNPGHFPDAGNDAEAGSRSARERRNSRSTLTRTWTRFRTGK